MLIFGLHSSSDYQLGWFMDSNPICHPTPTKKMKCSSLDYVQLLRISWAGQWIWTLSTTSLQPKKWNVLFWIRFNFWWLAWLVDGFEPHLPHLSSQKLKCSFLDYVQLLMIGMAGYWTWNPIHHHSPAKKWNAHFWITFNFWLSGRLVNELEAHLSPLSSHKNEMLVFGLCSTSDDRLGWLMDLNPIHHSLQPKNEMLIFGLCLSSDD